MPHQNRVTPYGDIVTSPLRGQWMGNRGCIHEGTDIVRGPDKAGITNLIEIMAAVTDQGPEAVQKEFTGSGYGAFKQAVADAVVAALGPVRERYEALRSREGELEGILAAGAQRARAIASETVALARDRMGVGPPVGGRGDGRISSP